MADDEVIKLFGFTLKRSKKVEKEEKQIKSPVVPSNEDGSILIDAAYSTNDSFLNIGPNRINEFELLTRYREMELHPDCDSAIDDIVNESISMTDEGMPVDINFSNRPGMPAISSKMKKRVTQEFNEILRLLNFSEMSYNIFRRWYVDGRIFFHAITIKGRERDGIKELRYIDPRQIKKVKEVEKEPDSNGMEIVTNVEEYFVYHQRGIDEAFNFATHNLIFYSDMQHINAASGTYKIHPDSIVYAHSGIVDKYSNVVYSHLHKAIRALNQLKMMEDASVIYRITRAPERRIFYVDVGQLPKVKGDQYIQSVKNKFRNSFYYNPETGEAHDDRQFYSMQEDYWIPRHDGSQGTSVETLPGGDNLGEISDIEYFQRKFYKALNVPIGRLDSQNNFNVGRVTEITRDELKFHKFVVKLRRRFSSLFYDLLKKQLILKGVVDEYDWRELKESIYFTYSRDNYFGELKDAEIMEAKLRVLREIEPYMGSLFSRKFVRQKVLHQNEDEQKIIDKEIKSEHSDFLDKAEDEFEIDSTMDPSIENEPTGFGNTTTSMTQPTKPQSKLPDSPEKKEKSSNLDTGKDKENK